MFVDQIELANQPMIVNFVPDGKMKGMTGHHQYGITASSKTENAAKQPEKKEIVPTGADGKLSKKQLNKMAKKEKKADLKAGGAPPAEESKR